MVNEVTAEVLSIGDELLIGQTLNTNAGWLGEQLSLIGIRPMRVRTIGDDRAAIIDAFATATCAVPQRGARMLPKLSPKRLVLLEVPSVPLLLNVAHTSA